MMTLEIDFFLNDKPWQKVLLADLFWEKNTAEWLKDSADKPKQTRQMKVHRKMKTWTHKIPVSYFLCQHSAF